MKNLALVVSSLLLGAGCSKAEVDDEPVSVTPQEESVAFEGKADPAYAATWRTPDGKSTLVLSPDGTGRMKSNVVTPGGAQSNDTPTHWKAGTGTLLFQASDGKTLRYFVERKGADTIELRRLKDSKIRLLYKRQKA